MNEQEQVDLLIHGFLDGELTQRQRTELKRLVQHNPSLKKELHALYRQKELFSSLPVEKAPKEITEEIRLRLERRMILDAEPAAQVRSIGPAQLLFRRIAAAAAMLLLPLGILTILVIQIMKPADDVLVGNPPIAGARRSGESAAPQMPSVAAVPGKAPALSLGYLTLITDQPIPVNEAIKNAVFANQLVSGASARRSEGSAVYRIQCSQAQMLSLLGDLEPVWANCSGRQWVLAPDDPAVAKAVVIEGIRADQMKALVSESSAVRLQMVASHIERLNQREPSDYLLRVRPEGEGTEESVLQPVKPKIAWTQEGQDLKRMPETAGKETADGPQVLLVIEVKSREEVR